MFSYLRYTKDLLQCLFQVFLGNQGIDRFPPHAMQHNMQVQDLFPCKPSPMFPSPFLKAGGNFHFPSVPVFLYVLSVSCFAFRIQTHHLYRGIHHLCYIHHQNHPHLFLPHYLIVHLVFEVFYHFVLVLFYCL